jgi:hypothetical protein
MINNAIKALTAGSELPYQWQYCRQQCGVAYLSQSRVVSKTTLLPLMLLFTLVSACQQFQSLRSTRSTALLASVLVLKYSSATTGKLLARVLHSMLDIK